jgi:hypothetical protein
MSPERTRSFKSKDYEDGWNDGSCSQLKHDCVVKDRQVAELKKLIDENPVYYGISDRNTRQIKSLINEVLGK